MESEEPRVKTYIDTSTCPLVNLSSRQLVNYTKMQRYFINLSFDGKRYHGWQIQPNGISVQEELQRALSLILRSDTEVTGAGRTDAGVHARTMIAHFDSNESIDSTQLAYRLNRVLPRDIAVNDIYETDNDMHARFSARKRTYRYFIHTKRDPFCMSHSVELHYPLDFEQMNKAARLLLEAKDFKAFCKSNHDAKTTFCDVSVARWVQSDSTHWYFEISADRFLRNMVRAVVGTLIEVGRGRMSMEKLRKVLAEGTRCDAGESMPAHGLFLWEVEY